MPNDFLKKEPNKTEKILYELAMNQHQMEKGLWSTSALAMALAILNKIKPEELAELITSGEARIKEFNEKLNAEIKKLDEEKKPKQPEIKEQD